MAYQEVKELWPKIDSLDFTFVLETGMPPHKDRTASRGPSAAGFVKHLWKSFMGYLDGYNVVRRSEPNEFWLNSIIPERSDLDDWRNLSLLRRSVHLMPSRQELADVATCLLASNFYYVLHVLPQYDGGYYRCTGSIRCRTDSRAVFQALAKLGVSHLQFVMGHNVLIDCVTDRDICSSCRRYRNQVTFHVRHLSEKVTISLRTSDSRRYKLSAFISTGNGMVRQTARLGCSVRDS